MKKTRQAATGKLSGTAVNKAYDGVRALIMRYAIKPGERLNEVELARQFQISRTPLREALNRLVVERLLSFEPSLGFSRPGIQAQDIIALYEFRVFLETVGVKLAIERASDADIRSVAEFWKKANQDLASKSTLDRIAADEAFHERLIALSDNKEMLHSLASVNARIHFVRWAAPINDNEHRASYKKHLMLIDAILARNQEQAALILNEIIVMRKEEITEILKEGAAKLYIG